MAPMALLLVLFAAQGDTASFTLRDFRFASGETLPQVRIHYRTLGHPRRDAAGVVPGMAERAVVDRSEEHTSELQSRPHLVCRRLLEINNTNVTDPDEHDSAC